MLTHNNTLITTSTTDECFSMNTNNCAYLSFLNILIIAYDFLTVYTNYFVLFLGPLSACSDGLVHHEILISVWKRHQSILLDLK